MNVELDWFEKHAMKRPCVWEKAPEEASAEDDEHAMGMWLQASSGRAETTWDRLERE